MRPRRAPLSSWEALFKNTREALDRRSAAFLARPMVIRARPGWPWKLYITLICLAVELGLLVSYWTLGLVPPPIYITRQARTT